MTRWAVAALSAAALVMTASPAREHRAVSGEPAAIARLPVRAPQYEVELVKSRMIPARDGVRLSADIYRPRAPGRYPVVVIRTPYDKKPFRTAPVDWAAQISAGVKSLPWGEQPIAAALPFFLASRGYVVAVIDLRGRGESEGTFFPYAATERTDGYDVIQWLAAQPWSTAKVGSFGCSFVGEVQYMQAAMHPPALVTAIMQSGSASLGAGGVWNFGFTRYGVTELAAAASWVPISDPPFSYGPPSGVDREVWFGSPAADRMSTTATISPPNAAAFTKALDTLPVGETLAVIRPDGSAFRDWLKNANDFSSPYWQRQGLITDVDTFDIPTLHINSWYDLTPTSTIHLRDQFRRTATRPVARDNQMLVMAPSDHCQFEAWGPTSLIGDRNVGNAHLNYAGLYLAWFDRWLKGTANGIERLPKTVSFAMNSGWTTSAQWPPAGARTKRLYLDGANPTSLAGDGTLVDTAPVASRTGRYTYDPLQPTPSLGGGICCVDIKAGAVDQRPVERRRDVLVYTSAPYPRGIMLAGPIRAHLMVGSDRPDTDFVATLSEVLPDGTSFILQSGVLRARWRDGLTKRAPAMVPEQSYPISIDLEQTHNWVAPGHRLRLTVASASFPRWDRNLNTGGDNWNEREPLIAHNLVISGGSSASFLEVVVTAK